jgi:hypothetical protein
LLKSGVDVHEDDTMNSAACESVTPQARRGWLQQRPRKLMLVGAIVGILLAVATQMLNRQPEGMPVPAPGLVHYWHRSDWESWKRKGAVDEWDARSNKSRWGIDCPVLADGYEIRARGADDGSLAKANPKALSPIRTLDLEGSLVTDAGLKDLERFDALVALDLDETRITNAGLQHLQTLSQLRWLSLRDTQISDEGLENFGRLTNLQWLDLQNTQVSDAGLEHLMDLPQLKRVYLAGTRITYEAGQKFQKARPTCSVSQRPFGGAALKAASEKQRPVDD